MLYLSQFSTGVLPLCVYHSGIKDVLDKLKETEPELEDLLHLPVESGGDYSAANGAHLIKVRSIDFKIIFFHLQTPNLTKSTLDVKVRKKVK